MTFLDELPIELLLAIHVESGSSDLPLVSKSFHRLFSATTDLHRAQWLVSKYGRKFTLSRAIKYPICSLSVLQLLENRFSTHFARSKKAAKVDQLPRRLVKGLTSTNHQIDMDFVKYLLDKHGCSPDSSNGYFLARAVFAKHIELVDLLLSYGASPDMNDGWAVRNAISDGDLAMVRRLLELTPPSTSEQEDSLCTNDYERDDKAKKRRRSDADKSSPRKRRKVEMRCKPTPKMLSTAVQAQQWPIVDYLTSKGATPSLEVLNLFA